MSTVTLAKNIALSLFGIAYSWFFTVSIPFYIADWDSGPFPPKMSAISLIAWLLMILGGCVFLWCYGLFILVGRGTPWPFDPPKRLVVAGPYRFVRNPMGASFLLIVMGEALLFGSITLMFYWLAGFAVLHIREVLFAEPALKRRFGLPYERYFKSVPRWIPQLNPYVEEKEGPTNNSLPRKDREGFDL